MKSEGHEERRPRNLDSDLRCDDERRSELAALVRRQLVEGGAPLGVRRGRGGQQRRQGRVQAIPCREVHAVRQGPEVWNGWGRSRSGLKMPKFMIKKPNETPSMQKYPILQNGTCAYL